MEDVQHLLFVGRVVVTSTAVTLAISIFRRSVFFYCPYVTRCHVAS